MSLFTWGQSSLTPQHAWHVHFPERNSEKTEDCPLPFVFLVSSSLPLSISFLFF